MARVDLTLTRTRHEVTLIHVLQTAEWLMHLGRTAAPCDRSGCKRPLGHGGTHYFTEDDILNEPQPLRPGRRAAWQS